MSTPWSSTGVRGNGTAGSEVAAFSATRASLYKTLVSLNLGIGCVLGGLKPPHRCGACGYSAMRTTR